MERFCQRCRLSSLARFRSHHPPAQGKSSSRPPECFGELSGIGAVLCVWRQKALMDRRSIGLLDRSIGIDRRRWRAFLLWIDRGPLPAVSPDESHHPHSPINTPQHSRQHKTTTPLPPHHHTNNQQWTHTSGYVPPPGAGPRPPPAPRPRRRWHT